jgi:transcriptional regulator with XRE-family HTH domain
LSRIGDKIKAARLSHDIPLKKLAKSCGVSESYLTDVESGKKVINDELIKKLSKLLETDLNDSMYVEAVEMENSVDERTGAARRDNALPRKNFAPAARPSYESSPTPEWQSAFSSIIKDVPIFNIDMNGAAAYKHLPILDRKVEGYNPEKLFFVIVPDSSISGYGVKKGDMVMVVSCSEMVKSGMYLVEYNGSRAIRHLKKLDGKNVLVLYNNNGLKTDTLEIHDIKILGHCVRAELDLTNL